MKVEELNSAIKSKKLSGIFFFYGEEDYLLTDKINAIAKKIITPGTEAFNFFKFEGPKVSAAEISAAVDQFPQMSEMKLVLAKNTKLLNNATYSDFKLIKSLSEHIPDDTCLIFVESDFDKNKLKNIEFIEENGGIVNFEYIPINKLCVWMEKLFEKNDKSILDKDISYIIQLCGQSLGKLTKECDKLLNYTGERRKITRDDINAVVDKTVEYRVYDMLNNMVAGQSAKAHEQLKYLRDRGEKPITILRLMISRLSEILMCKLLKEDGLSPSEISNYFDFKKPLFAVNKTIEESRKFGEKYLKRMIDKGLYYDLECISGKMDHWSAVEMYLAELTL